MAQKVSDTTEETAKIRARDFFKPLCESVSYSSTKETSKVNDATKEKKKISTATKKTPKISYSTKEAGTIGA